MKQIHLAFIFLLFSQVICAQTATVKGIVHLVDGQPVSHATVRIEGSTIGSVSDEQGAYELRQVPYGKQTILVTSINSETKKVTLNVKEPLYDLHIHIDPKGNVFLDEVRVVRNSAKREIETKGFAANVIETKEAVTRNIQTNELLDRSVGVRVLQSGGLGSEVQYNLNGMSGRSVGIFLDGIEMSTYGSSFNLNSIPPSMIERIEVYKGVLPAHLSGDLLGGAINIILKKGTSNNNLSASVSYGSFNTSQATLNALYRDAKTGFTTRVSGNFLNTDNDYRIWGKFSKYIHPDGVVERNFPAKRFFDGYRAISGRAEVGFTDVKWADNFFVGFNLSDSYKEIQHGQTMARPYMGRTADANAKVLSLQYQKKNLLLEGLDLSVNAVLSYRNTYIVDTVRNLYNWDGQIRYDLNGKPIYSKTGAQQGKPTMNSIDRKLYNFRNNLSYTFLPGHQLSVNHVYYTVDRKDKDRLNPENDLSGLSRSSDLSKQVLSFNYEAQTFDSKLTTNLFYKIYQQSITQTSYKIVNQQGTNVINPIQTKDNRSENGFGIAAAYKFLPQVIVLASAERAIRMPADTEMFGSPEENIESNFGLNPELSDNLNLGFKLGSFQFQEKHQLNFGANFFWRNVKDRIMPFANDQQNNQEIELTKYVNLGKAQSLGFEGELGYNYQNRFFLHFNFSKFQSLYKIEKDEHGNRLEYYNKQIPNEPYFTMNGNVEYRFDNLIQKKSQLNLFYTVGYVGSFSTVWFDSDWFITPTQVPQNLGLSYVFPERKLTASFDVKNVFNAEVYDHFGVQKPGRGFYLKLHYSINRF